MDEFEAYPRNYYPENTRRFEAYPNNYYPENTYRYGAYPRDYYPENTFRFEAYPNNYYPENTETYPKDNYPENTEAQPKDNNPENTTRSPSPPRPSPPRPSPPRPSSPRPSAPLPSPDTTSVHITALDGIVNVNSLFTVAVFVGLSLATPDQHSLENPGTCDAGVDVLKKLLVFEVVSFSFFLFSSLVAQGLKLAINLLNSNDVHEDLKAYINARVLRFGMLGSAFGSVMGCLFLMLSMINVIQIRLGMMSCGSKPAIRTVVALVLLVTTALTFYLSTAVYAFLH